MNPRYQGKTFLRFLECYVLHAIDELSDDDSKTMENITPQIQEMYGEQGTWYEVISKAMNLPSDFEDQIRPMWEKNRKLAQDNGETLLPQHFAEMFVDANLVE